MKLTLPAGTRYQRVEADGTLSGERRLPQAVQVEPVQRITVLGADIAYVYLDEDGDLIQVQTNVVNPRKAAV